jgi:hypothetical protein
LPNGEVYRPRYRLEDKSWMVDKEDVFDKKKWDAVWELDPMPGRAATGAHSMCCCAWQQSGSRRCMVPSREP